MLILFDVDATLITTARAGIAAMGRAGRDMFGAGFDESRVEYAGRLDPLIIADLLTAHQIEVSPASMQAFRDAYGHHLRALLTGSDLAKPCPGVPKLISLLETRADVTIGLLTGNFPETGRIKLLASGIDPDRFPIHVWGSDSPHTPPARQHLPPVGMERYRVLRGRTVDARKVTIVGDTPHDIACARAHGCRSLGVATGPYTIDALMSAGADRAVATLEASDDIARWLVDA
ncbi:MAG: HAD hydrolase-like protein [Planctomycetota bacterium]|nr:HAD hydrolase-like protein [Planctomycetota bacterium]